MRTINSDWKDLFVESVKGAERQIRIMAPYMKVYGTGLLVEEMRAGCSLSCLTDFQVANCYRGAADLASYEQLVGKGASLKSLRHLHAKVYVFDDARAIVTSGNLTYGGLVRNAEYGLLVEQPSTVQEIIADFDTISSRSQVHPITASIIERAREELRKQPAPRVAPVFGDVFDAPPTLPVLPETRHRIQAAARLCQQALWAYQMIEPFPQSFGTAILYQLTDALVGEFPTNNTPQNSLRSLMQDLRDAGLLQFVTRGTYKKLYV